MPNQDYEILNFDDLASGRQCRHSLAGAAPELGAIGLANGSSAELAESEGRH